MFKLKKKIPWWYKPFIRFMPYFYESVPEYKSYLGSDSQYWTTRVDIITTSFYELLIQGKEKGKYFNNHSAYLAVRWRAFWVSFTVSSEKGISWIVKKKTNV